MTVSVSGVGSVQVGAQQVVGAPGSAVRVMARLYDPDSVLLASGNVENVSLEVWDLGLASDVPVLSLPVVTPSSVIVSLSTASKWTKDATGFNFDHLLPSNVAAQLVGGRSYLLRYLIDTPRENPSAQGTDFGVLRYEVGLSA